ncbi:CPBP family intramembrane glutamic endopeptidase [Musicola keenii]|uniref:CPBP family intramembrane glutamic endopeptidase n=1 Tax=Musicola keenii TaxID=2884250 RepID=UPI00177A9518|nr:type II CAAX endopeptidase family protein [Musicola keenii]
MKKSIVNNIQNLTPWATTVLAAVVITWAWEEIINNTANWASLNGYAGYHLTAEHLAGMIFLITIAYPYHRWISPLGIGQVWQRSSVLPAIAVVAIYSIEFSYGKLTGQAPETWVETLLNQPLAQLSAVFLTILILSPVSEEIIFRGINLNVFRTKYKWTQWVGIVFVSLGFAAMHIQYQNLSTFVEMFTLSIVLAWARVRSGGMLLPIMLHSLASILAVIFTLLD